MSGNGKDPNEKLRTLEGAIAYARLLADAAGLDLVVYRGPKDPQFYVEHTINKRKYKPEWVRYRTIKA